MRISRIAALGLIAVSSRVSAQQSDTTVKLATRPLHPGVATLAQELSIGSLTGADEYLFGAISEVAVARDGTIYIYDRQVPALRKFNAAGQFVATLGRKGQGPGEYANAGGLAIAPDGRVLLWDTGNARINVYSSSGATLTQWPTPIQGTLSTGRSLMVDTASRSYMRRSVIQRIPGQPVTPQQVLVRHGANGALLDTLPAPSFGIETPSVTATSPQGNATASSIVPFAASPKWVMSPLGHVVSGVPDRYAFEIHSGTRSVISVRRDVPATPVSARERDSARTAVETNMRRTNPSWSWNGPAIPSTKPYYASLSAGDDGRIWVALIPEVAPAVGTVSGGGSVGGGAPAGAPAGPQPPGGPAVPPTPRPALYDVYEPDGTYLGQVQVPARVSSMVRRGDYVWGVATDEDDVQYVRRYRIVWR